MAYPPPAPLMWLNLKTFMSNKGKHLQQRTPLETHRAGGVRPYHLSLLESYALRWRTDMAPLKISLARCSKWNLINYMAPVGRCNLWTRPGTRRLCCLIWHGSRAGRALALAPWPTRITGLGDDFWGANKSGFGARKFHSHLPTFDRNHAFI